MGAGIVGSLQGEPVVRGSIAQRVSVEARQLTVDAARDAGARERERQPGHRIDGDGHGQGDGHEAVAGTIESDGFRAQDPNGAAVLLGRGEPRARVAHHRPQVGA